MAKKLTAKKAKEMLRHGEVHGKPLTSKQKKYFGYVAGSGKAQTGGWLDKYQTGGELKDGDPIYGDIYTGLSDVEARELHESLYKDYLNKKRGADVKEFQSEIRQNTNKFAQDYIVPTIKTVASFTPAGPAIGLTDAYWAAKRGDTASAAIMAGVEALPYGLKYAGKGVKTLLKNKKTARKILGRFPIEDDYAKKYNTNPDPYEVLEQMRGRIKTPEGQRRLIDYNTWYSTEGKISTDPLWNIDIIEDPTTYGNYRRTIFGQKIGLNPSLPYRSLKNVTRHELEHAIQKGGTTAIDDLLEGLELRKQPQPLVAKTKTSDIINANDLEVALQNRQRAVDYFTFGSEGREKSAMLAELQQYLADNKLISHPYASNEITPKKIKEVFMNKIGKGDYPLRIFDIMKPSEKNYKLISEGLNKMLSVAPVIGAGKLTKEKNNEERLDSYQDGGDIIRYDDEAQKFYEYWLNNRKDILQKNIDDNYKLIKTLGGGNELTADANALLQIERMKSAGIGDVNASLHNKDMKKRGVLALYSPMTHEVVYKPEVLEYYNERQSDPFLHERTHSATPKSYFKPQEYSIDNIVKRSNKYWDDSSEVYSRLMEFRKINKLDTKKRYTIDDIKSMRDSLIDTDLFNRYDDDTMLKLLNDVAYNNLNKSENTRRLENGGWLDKYQDGGEVDAITGPATPYWQIPIKQREDFKGNWLNRLIANNITPFKKGFDVGAVVDNDTLMRLSNKRVSGELNNSQVADSIRSYIKDRKTGEPLNKIRSFRPSNINASRDALYLHQGLPQKYDSFSVSKYTPSKSSNSNTDYYALTKGARGEIVNDLFKGNNKDFLESSEKERQVKNSTVGQAALRNFKYSKGKDEQGEYVSYYDINDYNNFLDKIGKPFEVYDRIYVDKDSTGKYVPKEKFKSGGHLKKSKELTNFTDYNSGWLNKYS